jgi:hypothetical protein
LHAQDAIITGATQAPAHCRFAADFRHASADISSRSHAAGHIAALLRATAFSPLAYEPLALMARQR